MSTPTSLAATEPPPPAPSAPPDYSVWTAAFHKVGSILRLLPVHTHEHLTVFPCAWIFPTTNEHGETLPAEHIHVIMFNGPPLKSNFNAVLDDMIRRHRAIALLYLDEHDIILTDANKKRTRMPGVRATFEHIRNTPRVWLAPKAEEKLGLFYDAPTSKPASPRLRHFN